MYDLEIIMPINNVGKYAKRLEDFKNYGLINTKNHKILLKLLIGNQEFSISGWPEGVQCQLIKCDSNDAAKKIFNYYHDLTEEQIQNSRWFAKIDDDTLNDIEGLVFNLDHEFDHTRDYYLVSEIRNEVHPVEKTIIEELGYNWYIPYKRPPWHEWECCVISQAAMQKIKTNKASQDFLRIRKQYEGWGDQGYALAARMAKIYPYEPYFLSTHAVLGNFSVFGGSFNHIHYIAHDIHPEKFYFFVDYLNSPIKNYNFILNNLCQIDIENKVVKTNNEPIGFFAENNTEYKILFTENTIQDVFHNDVLTFSKQSLKERNRDFQLKKTTTNMQRITLL